GQGILGTQGFDTAGTTTGFTAVNTGPTPTTGLTWPANVSAGFKVVSYNSLGQGAWIVETAFNGSSLLPVNPGQAYSASGWALYPASYSLNNLASVNIAWYGTTNPNSLISTTSGPGFGGIAIGQANGNWFQVVNLDAIAPAGAYYAQVQFSGGTNGSGVTLYLAAPTFGPGLNTTYFDGLFSPSPDYAYEGTPQLSPTSWYPNVLT